MISRAERGPVADWLRSVDRWLLGSCGMLMIVGVVMALAASPAVAERLGLPTFHFVNRQAELLLPCAILLVPTSFLSPRPVRRAALILFAVSMALIVAALLFGAEVKGSRRWIFGLQPSEFIKPAFVILAAWASRQTARPRAAAGDHRAADPGTGFRSDDAHRARLGVAVLHGGPALVLGRGPGRRRRGRRLRCVQILAARARTRAALHRSRFRRRHGRYIPGRYRVAEPAFRRLARPRPRRRRLQAHPPRRPHRLRLRRHGRRIRHGCVSGADRVLRVHRLARTLARGPQSGPVQPLRRGGADDHVRRAGLDEHGGEPAPDPGQGHDAAVHFLWRLIPARARPRHGFSRRFDPAKPDYHIFCPSPGPSVSAPAGVLLAAGGTGGHLFSAGAP